MERMTLDHWRETGRALGGGSLLDCPFRCPRCGSIATPSDFARLGADHDRATRECIGRVASAERGTSWRGGCDWAAFGLLGTMGRGIMVDLPDGRAVEVFPFATVAR